MSTATNRRLWLAAALVLGACHKSQNMPTAPSGTPGYDAGASQHASLPVGELAEARAAAGRLTP